MIALRIIAGIAGICLMWVYAFSVQELKIPIWRRIGLAAFHAVAFLVMFALLQFAMAGHL